MTQTTITYRLCFMCKPCQTSMMPTVGFTRGGGVHPCHFGFCSSTCKALELFGNDHVVLAQPLVRISASCKAALESFPGQGCVQNEQSRKTPAQATLLSARGRGRDPGRRRPRATAAPSSPSTLEVKCWLVTIGITDGGRTGSRIAIVAPKR